MAKVPAFSDVGKAAKELLYGGKDGAFQFNQVVSLSSKTADGVEFNITAVKRDDKVEPMAKVTYKVPTYSLAATFNASGKVLASVSTEPAPGLDVVVSGSIPDPGSGKISLGYVLPHLTLKSTFGVTQNPKVDMAATTGYQNAVLGAAGLYDTAQGKITTWTLGAGYTGLDYQVGLTLTDNDLVKAVYAHNIDATSTAGAEIQRSLTKEVSKFTAGYAKRLENDSLLKLRLDNEGALAFLYESEVRPKTKVGITGLFNATNLNATPKWGVSVDAKN